MKRDKSLTKQRLNGVWETDRWNEFKSNSIVRSELFRTKLCTIFPPLSSIFGVSFALATRSWHVGAGRVADEARGTGVLVLSQHLAAPVSGVARKRPA